MRSALSMVLIALGACGPTVEEGPRTCGGWGPVRIFEDVAVGYPAYAGDRILAYTGQSIPLDPTRTDAIGVGPCGEDPVLLGTLNLEEPWNLSVAGEHVVRVDESGDLSWVDPFGSAPVHSLVSGANSCVLSLAGGMVVRSIDGRLLFRPDPASSEESTRVLLDQVAEPEFPSVPFFDLADCSAIDTVGPVVDGDGVLAVEAGGALVRVALPSGERQLVLEGPVGEFVVLDDPRYLLWRTGETGDCCDIHLLDRSSGTSERVWGGSIIGGVDWAGDWLSMNFLRNGDLEQRELFHNYVTGERVEVEGWWKLQAVVSPSDLLVSAFGDTDVRILDVVREEMIPIEFNPLAFPERVYDDGVVSFRPDGHGGDRGDLLRLRFGSREPELLVSEAPFAWLRTRQGNTLFIDRDEESDVGPLVLVEANGARRELAVGVSAVAIPHRGTARERNEAIYFVAQGVDRGMWRVALP